MSEGNQNHRDKMGLFAPGRSPDLDERIQQTKELIRNTRAFLDGLQESEQQTRAYLKELSESLERDLERLCKKASDRRGA
jgi:hypothetical protein